MQSVLVKIVPPAQTPAPCDQRTARVRTTVDLCLDLLAKVLRSATVRSAILREENRVSLGPPAQKSARCELRGARCDRRNGSLRHGLRAASGALRAAIVPQHMPGLDAASCNLRAAACDWPTARGLRLADCGSQIRMQSDSPVHSPGHNDATCDVRRAVCDVADGGLSIALGTMMRRATCDVQSATADDCKLRVAACRMRPSGTMFNGLLRTFSDS